MKKAYTQTLKHYFRVQLIRTRGSLQLTQAKMARKLFVEDRSYSALESGESCCGALTLALFLVFCCADPTGFIEELREEFEETGKRAA